MRRKPPRTIEDDLREWTPVTKLGRLVKLGKITKLEEIYVHSLPIREHQIIDQIFYNMGGVGPAGGGDDAFGRGGKVEAIKDEVMKVLTVQKQTKAGQRTRHKAFVTVGDYNGHVGLGVKCAKEVATAIRGAIAAAKLSIIPVNLCLVASSALRRAGVVAGPSTQAGPDRPTDPVTTRAHPSWFPQFQ
eukprot:GHVU01064485.1.p1 GENE.GHVU01064485.1~~GHVU01064485.1.p1  ORF type:complete len:188 (+),score=28.48 GHVU01064485.1:813-1376(+)